MKNLITLILALVSLTCAAQSIQYRNLNTSQFGSNNFSVSLKDGVLVTNPVSYAVATIAGYVNATNANVTNTFVGKFSASNAAITNTGTIMQTKSIFPETHASYSLGTTGDRWKDIYSSDNIIGGTFTGNGAGITNLNGSNIGNINQTNITAVGVLASGDGIVIGSGTNLSGLLSNEENVLGQGYLAGYGSLAGGSFASAYGSFPAAGAGSVSLGLFDGSRNAYLDGQFGSSLFGDLAFSRDSYWHGWWSAGSVNLRSSSNALVNSWGSLLAINAQSKTNVSINASNSVVVGTPPTGFSGGFVREIAVIGADGSVQKIGTNGFTGDGSGLTNLNASSLSSGTVAQNRLTAGVTTNNGVLTSGRVQVGDGGRGVGNATASGAVPIDADGTATTAAQLIAVVVSNTLTNGQPIVTDGTRLLSTNRLTLSRIDGQFNAANGIQLSGDASAILTGNANGSGASKMAGSAGEVHWYANAGATFQTGTSTAKVGWSSGTTGTDTLDTYIERASAGTYKFSTNIIARGTIGSTNTHSAYVVNTTNPGFRSTGTNILIMACPDGGSWILRVGNDGTLTTTTNTSAL